MKLDEETKQNIINEFEQWKQKTYGNLTDKQRKELERQINAIKKDDTILTSGGIYARVIAVKEQDVEAEISHGVRVKISKSAIVSVIDNNKTITPEIVKK